VPHADKELIMVFLEVVSIFLSFTCYFSVAYVRLTNTFTKTSSFRYSLFEVFRNNFAREERQNSTLDSFSLVEKLKTIADSKKFIKYIKFGILNSVSVFTNSTLTETTLNEINLRIDKFSISELIECNSLMQNIKVMYFKVTKYLKLYPIAELHLFNLGHLERARKIRVIAIILNLTINIIIYKI
jgi:hypothetical protein